jgi:hypothetical protein
LIHDGRWSLVARRHCLAIDQQPARAGPPHFPESDFQFTHARQPARLGITGITVTGITVTVHLISRITVTVYLISRRVAMLLLSALKII